MKCISLQNIFYVFFLKKVNVKWAIKFFKIFKIHLLHSNIFNIWKDRKLRKIETNFRWYNSSISETKNKCAACCCKKGTPIISNSEKSWCWFDTIQYCCKNILPHDLINWMKVLANIELLSISWYFSYNVILCMLLFNYNLFKCQV